MHESYSKESSSDEGFGKDDEEDEENDAVNNLEPGAAIRKMQLLA
jgi:hypothetical protein